MKPIFSMTILSSLISLTFIAAASDVPAADKKLKAQTEVIVVNGQRNQPDTEVTAETAKLFKVAGIDNDPLSAVFTMPGVVYAGGDDGGEPAIRGSSPQDNAYYIDNIPASYIFHLFGDSIFNKNVVQDFSLHSASFGSKYGNATGGVFDVKLRAPRNQDFKTTIDVSMLKAGFMLEGGVTEDHAFYVSYRQSLIHLFLPTGEEEDGLTITKSPKSNDYQAKYQWLIGDDHRVTVTALGATDTGGLNISKASEEGRTDPDLIGDLKLTNGFNSQSIAWDGFGDHAQTANITFSHTKDTTKESYGAGQFIESEFETLNLATNYQREFGAHKLIVGTEIEQGKANYSFDIIPYFCTEQDADCAQNKGDRINDSDNLKMVNSAVYFTDLWLITDSIELELGARAEYNDYTKQSFVHPRVAVSWYATDDLTLSAKTGQYNRFPDIDTVLKKLGNPQLKSPTATHVALGGDYRINDVWHTSIEVYQKSLGNLAISIDEQQDPQQLRYNNQLEGKASGVEWVVKRDMQDGWYGWASLSWSKSERTDLNTHITTDYYLDTPLLGNAVINYKLNDKWDFGARFTMRSGARYTPIVGLRDNPDHPGNFLPNYGKLNGKTLPVYSRLDLQANMNSTVFSHPVQWSFAILNAMGSKNESGYYYVGKDGDTLTNYEVQGEEGMEPFISIGLKTSF
jgi:outer membrane receptor for ferrienterochelin and colicin